MEWMTIVQIVATALAILLVIGAIIYARQTYKNYMIVNRILSQALLLPAEDADFDKIMEARYPTMYRTRDFAIDEEDDHAPENP